MNIINDKVTAYINEQYRPQSPELMEIRLQAEAVRVPIVLRDTEGLLLNLIQLKRPVHILEIGTAIGYSAACMAAYFETCRITTIESDEAVAEIARQNIERLGFADRITLLQGKAQDLMDDLKGPFDFVFIDASKSHYRIFWDKALTLCSPGAVILCDNILMQGMTVSEEYDPRKKHKTHIRKMREFLDYITSADYVDTSLLPVGDGVSLSILKG